MTESDFGKSLGWAVREDPSMEVMSDLTSELQGARHLAI